MSITEKCPSTRINIGSSIIFKAYTNDVPPTFACKFIDADDRVLATQHQTVDEGSL